MYARVERPTFPNLASQLGRMCTYAYLHLSPLPSAKDRRVVDYRSLGSYGGYLVSGKALGALFS